MGSQAGTTAYTSALLTNPDMSKAKGMAYIDTIMGYACPRISKALGLGVGVNDLDAVHQVVSIYPNPAAATTTLKLENNIHDGNVLVTITDNTGREIERINWNASQSKTLSLDLKKYSKGIYVINAVAKSFSSKQKLVVQ